jgi:hypothetical protein
MANVKIKAKFLIGMKIATKIASRFPVNYDCIISLLFQSLVKNKFGNAFFFLTALEGR